MAKVELNVLFKKQQKDDKKEVLEFHYLGESIPNIQDLIAMSGKVTVLQVAGLEKFTAHFKSIQFDDKKNVLKFNVTGDSDEKTLAIYPKAGQNTQLVLESAQMDASDIVYDDEDQKGIRYAVDKNGNVQLEQEQEEAIQGQLTLDEIAPAIEEAAEIETEEKDPGSFLETLDNSPKDGLIFDNVDDDELD
jgi:hypothetical protein